MPSGNYRSRFERTIFNEFPCENPKVDIVALCDIYQPSIDEALKLAPKAKVYGNYKEVLEDKNIDAVLVATPLSAHYKIVMDAFDAGKHVFCEKSIGYTMEECYHIYQKHRSTGKFSSPDSNVSLIRAISRRWK